MGIVLSILFIVGAMLIVVGAFMVHLGKSLGAGALTFGIILLGISAGLVRIGA